MHPTDKRVSEEISIELVIGDRKYPVKASPKDKDTLLTIQKTLNHELQGVQLKYANRDRQDALAMTLLSYAKRLQDLQDQVNSTSTTLSEVEKNLDKALS